MTKIYKLFFIFLLCLASFNTYAAELSISIDKKVITEADTLFLSIEYSGDDDQKPDLSPLTKDFRIVSNSTSQQINFINGYLSQSTKWRVGLQPLKLGKIAIKPIRIGNLISNSEEVEVKEVTNVAYVPDRRENSNSPYFQIEQNLNTKNPYVQQQTTLLVTIYDSIGLQDGNISVNEDAKKDWIIIPLTNQPIIKEDVINYKKMFLETYAFALFPQKSGELKLPQISFDGYYIRNNDFNFPNFNDDLTMFGVNFHNVFGQRVPVRMKTKEQTVNVQPVPADFSGSHWLPLSDLKLDSSWSVKKGFKVGEAVTRTISLTAKGMTESMLPQINFASADGLKQYPEKPEVTESVDKGMLVTSAQINNVYIPTKAGELTVPEIALKWFDVNTNTIKTAVIPEETIFVLPNSEMKTEEQAKPVVTDQKKDDVSNENNKPQKEIQNDVLTNTKDDAFATALKPVLYKIYIGIALGIILFILLLSMLFARKKKNVYRNAVIKAIRRHDYKKAKDALLVWAKDKYYPANINNFNDIAQTTQNPEFTEILSEFNKFLYSDSTDFFDNAKFIEILKKVDKMKKKSVKNIETLPNLYD